MVTKLHFIKSASGASVNTLSISDCFTSNFKTYQVVYNSSNTSTNTNLDVRLLDSSNAEVTTTTYQLAGLDMPMTLSSLATEVRRTGDTGWLNIGNMATDSGKRASGMMRIFNPFESSVTYAQSQMSGFNINSQARGRKNIYVETTAQQYKGLKFYIVASTGITMDIDVSVYGVA